MRWGEYVPSPTINPGDQGHNTLAGHTWCLRALLWGHTSAILPATGARGLSVWPAPRSGEGFPCQRTVSLAKALPDRGANRRDFRYDLSHRSHSGI